MIQLYYDASPSNNLKDNTTNDWFFQEVINKIKANKEKINKNTV